MHRRNDHQVPAILYMVQNQVPCVGFQPDAHTILVIIGPAGRANIHVYSRPCLGRCQGNPRSKFSTCLTLASNAALTCAGDGEPKA